MLMFKHLLKRLRRFLRNWTENGRLLLSTTFTAKWVGFCHGKSLEKTANRRGVILKPSEIT